MERNILNIFHPKQLCFDLISSNSCKEKNNFTHSQSGVYFLPMKITRKKQSAPQYLKIVITLSMLDNLMRTELIFCLMKNFHFKWFIWYFSICHLKILKQKMFIVSDSFWDFCCGFKNLKIIQTFETSDFSFFPFLYFSVYLFIFATECNNERYLFSFHFLLFLFFLSLLCNLAKLLQLWKS